MFKIVKNSSNLSDHASIRLHVNVRCFDSDSIASSLTHLPHPYGHYLQEKSRKPLRMNVIDGVQLEHLLNNVNINLNQPLTVALCSVEEVLNKSCLKCKMLDNSHLITNFTSSHDRWS
jgi:hypothetical protein